MLLGPCLQRVAPCGGWRSMAGSSSRWGAPPRYCSRHTPAAPSRGQPPRGPDACGSSAGLLARLPLQLPPSSVWLGQCTMAGPQDAPLVMVWSMCSSGTAGHAGSGGQEGADCQGQGCTQQAAHLWLVLWWRRCDAGGRFWCDGALGTKLPGQVAAPPPAAAGAAQHP